MPLFWAIFAGLSRGLATRTTLLWPNAGGSRPCCARWTPGGPTPLARDSPSACRFWEGALAAADGTDAPAGLPDALAGLGPQLVWTQNPNYRRAPPSEDFLDQYGYAVLVGPRAGPPALVEHATLALGVLLLGPGTQYPLHHHPATEIYVPLNEAEWWRGGGPWREEAPGAVILHPSGVPHATRTGRLPLLAIYLWSGDLGTHARLVGAETAKAG